MPIFLKNLEVAESSREGVEGAAGGLAAGHAWVAVLSGAADMQC